MKYAGQAVRSFDASTTGVVGTLNANVAEGTDLTERLGSRIHNLEVQIRGRLTCVVGTKIALCALYVILDSQPDGSIPAVLDVLTTPSSHSFVRTDRRDRFRVLYRGTWVVIGADGLGNQSSKSAHQIDINLNLKERTTFSDPAGGIANLTAGHIFLMSIGDVASGAADPYFFVQTRVLYADG